MAFHEVEGEMTADKTSLASIPPARKKITTKIYHLSKSIYSSVVRNSFSCLIVLLAVVWSPELGLYIFLFGWCVCWFVFLSCWSVSGRFGSGRKREGGLTRVENRRDVVPFYLCPLIVDMSPDVMRYSAQSYLVIYRATRGLGLVKRLRCSSVFKQKYSFKGVGISGKFDQYFPVTTDEQPPTDFRKTRHPHGHSEPDQWPLSHTHHFPWNSNVSLLTLRDRIVVIT